MAVHGIIAMIFVMAAAPPPNEAREGPVDMRRARDGNIAIQEELDAARRAATVEAYDLFIARHPDHPLAKLAREERRRLIDKCRERRT
jgi:hypothetical protein